MVSDSHAAELAPRVLAGRARRGFLSRAVRTARRKPGGTISALIIAFMLAMAVTAPLLAPHDPLEVHSDRTLAAPSRTYPMGTDNFGRDVLSRMIHGARLSMGVGLTAVVLSVALGTALGVLSAYWGGAVDMVLQRVMDILMAFPSLLLALILVAVAGASVLNVILAIGITQAPAISRVIRSATLVVRQQQFVESAQSIGAGHLRLMAFHVLPNVMAVIIVYASINIGYAILTEASLSFLGLGVPPPAPSWGGMLNSANEAYLQQAPWLAIFPGLAISVAVLAFNILGDALRDLLDPRLRGGN